MNANESYKALFSDEEKAAAFDKIAENFYECNFGTMQKSDLETLMFSIYLDKILEDHEDDYNAYSDYTLSKVLGITQARVSNLKVRKELKYPYANFDWKISFSRICDKARIENGKIKLYIPDQNLYLELKNEIESHGGFIDVTLNSKLLVISPEYFLGLMYCMADDEDRKRINAHVKDALVKWDPNFAKDKKFSFNSDTIKKITVYGLPCVSEIIKSCFAGNNPVVGASVKVAMDCISQLIISKLN